MWSPMLGTRIGDVGLKHLEGLANLKRLYVNGTYVTDEGLASFRQALPNCKIDL